MFLWSQSLSVGDIEIDKQHQTFFDKINELENAGKQGKADIKAGEILSFLIDYAKKHFLDEEKYMADHHYPGVEKHALVHAKFVNRLVEFMTEFKQSGGTPELAGEMAQFMGTWLLNHIETVDQSYARYIETNG